MQGPICRVVGHWPLATLLPLGMVLEKWSDDLSVQRSEVGNGLVVLEVHLCAREETGHCGLLMDGT